MQRQAGRSANVGPVPYYAHWFHPPELTPLPGDAPILAHAIATIVSPKRQIMVGEWLPPPISIATRDAIHGLPVAVKDNRATKDMRPTHASPIYKDNVPDADDPNVALLRDAGAAVFAKTNLPEFGAGANTVNRVFGATGSRPRWFSGIA